MSTAQWQWQHQSGMQGHSKVANGSTHFTCMSAAFTQQLHAGVQVWSVCPIDSSSSLREENAIVCCSMLGGLTASKCLCDEIGHAEPDLLRFITNWQQVCSTETLSKVWTTPSSCCCAVIVCNGAGLSCGWSSSVSPFCMVAGCFRVYKVLKAASRLVELCQLALAACMLFVSGREGFTCLFNFLGNLSQ